VFFIDGELVGLMLFGIAGAFWVIIPFLDRKMQFGRVTRFFTGLGVFALGYIVVLSCLAIF
jgi:quinol-cytochrome oxidoreductase complex cytochrome b subunit